MTFKENANLLTHVDAQRGLYRALAIELAADAQAAGWSPTEYELQLAWRYDDEIAAQEADTASELESKAALNAR